MAFGERLATYSVNTGIRREFFARRLTVNLGITDLFKTKQYGRRMAGLDYDQAFWRKWNSRYVTLTATWAFGNGESSQRKQSLKEKHDTGGITREEDL